MWLCVYVCICDLQMFSGQCFGYLSGLIASLCLNGIHYLPIFFVFASYFTIYHTKLHTIKLGDNILIMLQK